MIEDEEDFRISIAGAQEKTALLFMDEQWCLPMDATPTTHIIKLPIGLIKSHSFSIDLSDSVENEFICTLIAREFGLPQEDFCQALNIPSARKYENQGGPTISDIMLFLLGSSDAENDRYLFMKAQVLFWLLAATDGHAKNFSLFIEPEGRYRLTPFYDILSLYPAIGLGGLHSKSAKLAMGLVGTKGKKYNVEQIFPRHFYQTAKAVGFEQDKMKQIFAEFAETIEIVIARVNMILPEGFPAHIRDPILNGLKSRARRLFE